MEGNSPLQNLMSDLSDFYYQDLEELRRRTERTARSLRKVADKLDKVWRYCKTAHALGTSAGIVGGMLTIGGGIAKIMKWTGASLLLDAGMQIGAAGALTNLGTSHVETFLNSTEIKKAEKDLKETFDYINNVRDTVQKGRDTKDVVMLLWKGYLTKETLSKPGAVEPENVCAHNAGQAGAQAVGRAGGQAAGDVAESGAKAGAKAGSKLTGGLIIGISIPFLILDALDLGYTIRDIVENEGSEAASFLREKAKELEGLF